MRNPGLIRGARLLDVGCGTSILCLFGAQGGAASVVGLDGSARIAACARQVSECMNEGRNELRVVCSRLAPR
jgi:protein arginine N-methyltransferase 3